MALLPWWVQYPNVNDEILNLDWILKTVNENNFKIENFIGLNTIKYADPILWDITHQYEANTIVVDPQTGDAYISTKAVPYGVALSNDEYWTIIYNYAYELNILREQIAVDEQLSTTATAARSVDDLVFVKGLLYKITSPMIAGDSYVEGSNCVKTTINAELAKLHLSISGLSQSIDNESIARADADTALGQRIDNEALARSNADTALGQRIDNEALARSNADTALGQRIDSSNYAINNAINALMSKGVILSSYNIIRVSSSPSGEFVDLNTAISNAANSSTPTIILLEEGMYDMGTLFPPETYSEGMKVPNHTYLIGNGEAENVHLVASFVSDNNKYSVVNLTLNSGLMNMKIQGYRTRYCVHDDFSEDGEYTRIVENVILYGNKLALRWAYGAGTNNGNTTVLKNVTFKNDNGCFSIHNRVGAKYPTKIILEDCNFLQYLIGDNPYDIILTAMGEESGIKTHGDVIVNVHNCNASVIQFGAQTGYTNYFYVNCDNEDTALYFGYDPYKMNCNGIVKCSNTQSLTMGKLVTFTNYGKQCQAFETGYNKTFANGVTISGTTTDGFNQIVVRTKGFIQGSDIGIAVQPSKYLNYDATTGSLIVSDTEGEIPVAYGLASGFWKLILN